jgi:hypothetical protein
LNPKKDTVVPLKPLNLNMGPMMTSPAAKLSVNDPGTTEYPGVLQVNPVYTAESEQVDKNGAPDGGIIVASVVDFPMKYCAGSVMVMSEDALTGFIVRKKNETV